MTIREQIAEAKYEYEGLRETNRDGMDRYDVRELEMSIEVSRKKLERLQLKCLCNIYSPPKCNCHRYQ